VRCLAWDCTFPCPGVLGKQADLLRAGVVLLSRTGLIIRTLAGGAERRLPRWRRACRDAAAVVADCLGGLGERTW